ncbi:MAG: hypothetical protein JNL25_12480 [Rhodospirillaceae bacterium]|nr:hypothetical protein [Rhodospirillaceae bacterium]
MRYLLVLFLGLSLSACVNVPPPTYKEPFAGILNINAASVPTDQAVNVGLPMGVIFTDNVETYLKYSKEGQELIQSFGPLTNSVAEADIEPTFVAGRVLSLLKSYYPDLELLPDFNQAVAKGKQSVCVIDIQMAAGAMSGDTTRIDISTYFFDASMTPVSRISGHGSGVIPYPAFDPQIQASTDMAVGELKAKYANLLQIP